MAQCVAESLDVTSAFPPSFSLSLLVIQHLGETLRPVWGLMDKCYPVTTQVGKSGGPFFPWSAVGTFGTHRERLGPGTEGPQSLIAVFPSVETQKQEWEESL